MQTEQVEIKSKGSVVWSGDYAYPESLDEALEVDGEEKIFKLYLQQRKIRWTDAKRREVTGGGIPRELINMLKTASPEQVEKLMAMLAEA